MPEVNRARLRGVRARPTTTITDSSPAVVPRFTSSRPDSGEHQAYDCGEHHPGEIFRDRHQDDPAGHLGPLLGYDVIDVSAFGLWPSALIIQQSLRMLQSLPVSAESSLSNVVGGLSA